MGKFNWRGAAQGALGSIYNDLQQNQDQKRAYERQDREMAAQLYAKMLESGVDPASLNMDAAGLGKYMQDALKQYGPAMAEADRKKAEQEIENLYNSEYTKGIAKGEVEKLYPSEANKPTEFETQLEMIKTPEGRKTLQDLYALKNPNIGLDTFLKGIQTNLAALNLQKAQDEMSGNKPLPTRDLQNYPGMPAGTTEKDVRDKGLIPLTSDDQKVLQNIRDARKVVKRAQALAQGLITAKDAKEVLWQKRKWFSGKTGLNPSAKKYMDFIDANKSLIAKGIKKQSGNLAIEEQEAAKGEFANFDDVTQTRDDKFNYLIRLLDANEQEILTGKPVDISPINPGEVQPTVKTPDDYLR